MLIDASYLRDRANKFIALARFCPHRATCHELEAMAAELMEKATYVDKSSAITPPLTLDK
jgi:F420-dependent methylenetetrahydromethanopterin dehydrogenase